MEVQFLRVAKHRLLEIWDDSEQTWSESQAAALFEGRSLQSMKRRTLDTAGDRSYGKVFPAFTSCDTNGTCFFVRYPRMRLG